MTYVRTLLTAGVVISWVSAPAWSQITGGAGAVGGAAGQAGAAGQVGGNVGIGAGGSAIFGGIPQSPFFANPAVRQELQLNNQQFNSLNRNFLQTQQALNQQMNALRAQRNLSPAQRQARIQQLNRQFGQQFSTGLNDVFPNQQTRNRFNQLNLQFQGLSAFSNPAIQQQLNLTADQQARLNQLSSQWEQTLQHFAPEFRTNPTVVEPQLNRLRREQTEQLRSILSPEQMQTWRQLVGNPFDFPASAFFSTQQDAGVSGEAGASAQTATQAGGAGGQAESATQAGGTAGGQAGAAAQAGGTAGGQAGAATQAGGTASGQAGTAAQAGGAAGQAQSATQAGGTAGQAQSATQAGAQGAAQVGSTTGFGFGVTGMTGFGATNQTPFFANAAVRQELGLSPQQFNQLNQNFLQSRQAIADEINRLQTQKNLTPAERQARIQQLRQQFDQRFSTGLNDVLTNEQIRNRFDQLRLQFQGPNAFADPLVQQRLNLTADQQAQLNQLASQWNQTLQGLGPQFQNNPAAVDAQLHRLQNQFMQQLSSILTPEQLETWRRMVGQPFNFSSAVFFSTQGTAGTAVETDAGEADRSARRGRETTR